MSNPPVVPEPVAVWQIRFTGLEPGGRQVVLLDQEVEWLAGPNTSPDLGERVAGGLGGLEMALTDDRGRTVRYGPLNRLPDRG